MKVGKVLLIAVAAAATPRAVPAQFTAALLPAPPVIERLSAENGYASPGSNALRDNAMAPAGAWFDSAMGALASDSPPKEGASVALTEPTQPGAVARPALDAATAVGDTVYRNGGLPPETSSTFPVLALAGVGTLLIGVALLRR